MTKELGLNRESMLVALQRRWWIIVLLTLLGGAIAAYPDPGETVDATTTWTATHTLLLSNTGSTQGGYIDQVAFNQLQLFATTGEVPKRAAEQIDYPGGGSALAAQLVVTGKQEQAALLITTTQDSAESAVSIADAVGDELVSYLAERQDALREERLTATLTRLQDLEKRLQKKSSESAFAPDDAVLRAQADALSRQYSVVFEQYDELRSDQSQLVLTTLGRAEAVAIEQSGLSAPRSRLSRGLLGALAGLAAGVLAAMLLARLDRKLRTVEQTEAIFGHHVQLAIPEASAEDLRGVAVHANRHDSLSDSFRRVRSIVTFLETGLALEEGHAPTVAVVSAGPSEGKTSMTVNLAAAMAEAGTHVVAVNTDFRRPTLSTRLLGRKNPTSQVPLDEIARMPASMLLTRTAADDLDVFDLAGVAGSPGDLTRATCRALPELATIAGVVLVDTSPIGATAEVLEVIPRVDIVVVTVRLGHTSIDAARRAADTLRALSHAEMVLVLVGDADDRAADYYYEYSSADSGRRGRRQKA